MSCNFIQLFESGNPWLSVKQSKTAEEAEACLKQFEKAWGRYSTTFYISPNEIIKVSPEDKAFAAFAMMCKGNNNSLFPKVFDFVSLPDGTFCCRMERVTPLIKFKDAYNIEELVDCLTAGNGVPEAYAGLMQSLHFTESDLDSFVSQVSSLGNDDIHVNNMGRRKDGSLVIFDPVN